MLCYAVLILHLPSPTCFIEIDCINQRLLKRSWILPCRVDLFNYYSLISLVVSYESERGRDEVPLCMESLFWCAL